MENGRLTFCGFLFDRRRLKFGGECVRRLTMNLADLWRSSMAEIVNFVQKAWRGSWDFIRRARFSVLTVDRRLLDYEWQV